MPVSSGCSLQEHGAWRLVGPGLPSSLDNGRAEVLGLWTSHSTTVALVAVTGARGTDLFAAWSAPSEGWATSLPLAVGHNELVASFGPGRGKDVFALLQNSSGADRLALARWWRRRLAAATAASRGHGNGRLRLQGADRCPRRERHPVLGLVPERWLEEVGRRPGHERPAPVRFLVVTKARDGSSRKAPVDCDAASEAISARMDGEELPMASTALDAHLAGCPRCRDFEAEVATLGRSAASDLSSARTRRPGGRVDGHGRAFAAPVPDNRTSAPTWHSVRLGQPRPVGRGCRAGARGGPSPSRWEQVPTSTWCPLVRRRPVLLGWPYTTRPAAAEERCMRRGQCTVGSAGLPESSPPAWRVAPWLVAGTNPVRQPRLLPALLKEAQPPGPWPSKPCTWLSSGPRSSLTGAGYSLYVFGPDRRRAVTCTGTCALSWPPLTVPASTKPTSEPGVEAGLVGTVSSPRRS